MSVMAAPVAAQQTSAATPIPRACGFDAAPCYDRKPVLEPQKRGYSCLKNVLNPMHFPQSPTIFFSIATPPRRGLAHVFYRPSSFFHLDQISKTSTLQEELLSGAQVRKARCPCFLYKNTLSVLASFCAAFPPTYTQKRLTPNNEDGRRRDLLLEERIRREENRIE